MKNIFIACHIPQAGLLRKTICFGLSLGKRGVQSKRTKTTNAVKLNEFEYKREIKRLCSIIKNKVSMMGGDRQVGLQNEIYGLVDEIYNLCK